MPKSVTPVRPSEIGICQAHMRMKHHRHAMSKKKCFYSWCEWVETRLILLLRVCFLFDYFDTVQAVLTTILGYGLSGVWANVFRNIYFLLLSELSIYIHTIDFIIKTIIFLKYLANIKILRYIVWHFVFTTHIGPCILKTLQYHPKFCFIFSRSYKGSPLLHCLITQVGVFDLHFYCRKQIQFPLVTLWYAFIDRQRLRKVIWRQTLAVFLVYGYLDIRIILVYVSDL